MVGVHLAGSELVGTRSRCAGPKGVTDIRRTARTIGEHRLSPVILASVNLCRRRGTNGTDGENEGNSDDVRNRRRHRSLSICYDYANLMEMPVHRFLKIGEPTVKKGSMCQGRWPSPHRATMNFDAASDDLRKGG